MYLDTIDMLPNRAVTKQELADAWRGAVTLFNQALEDSDILTMGIVCGVSGAGKTYSRAPNIEHDARVLMFEAVWDDKEKRSQLARRIVAAGKRAVCIWARAPLTTCVLRMRDRPAWRQVPRTRLVEAYENLRWSPPTRGEGWHEVRLVGGV